MALIHRSLVRLEKQSMKFRSASVCASYNDASSDLARSCVESTEYMESAPDQSKAETRACSCCERALSFMLCRANVNGGAKKRLARTASRPDIEPRKSTQLARQCYLYVGGKCTVVVSSYQGAPLYAVRSQLRLVLRFVRGICSRLSGNGSETEERRGTLRSPIVHCHSGASSGRPQCHHLSGKPCLRVRHYTSMYLEPRLTLS